MLKIGPKSEGIFSRIIKKKPKTEPNQYNKFKVKPDTFEKTKTPLETMEEKCPGYSLMDMITGMFRNK